jgi:hypothetical protein
MIYPSYMMFTVPASKVFTPPSVVRRTRSKVPPKAILPAEGKTAAAGLFMLPEDTQVFPVIFVKTTIPEKRSAAVILLTIIGSILYNTAETKNNESAEMSYLEMHSDEISVYEVGALLDNKEIIELENELIYNNLN